MVVIEKQNMKVIIIESGKDPIIKRIPNRLETLRKIVGNESIEVIKYKDILIVFDEEATKKLLPINRTIDGIILNLSTCVLCLNNHIATKAPKAPPNIVNNKSKNSEILHLLYIAWCLSYPYRANVIILMI